MPKSYSSGLRFTAFGVIGATESMGAQLVQEGSYANFVIVLIFAKKHDQLSVGPFASDALADSFVEKSI